MSQDTNRYNTKVQITAESEVVSEYGQEPNGLRVLKITMASIPCPGQAGRVTLLTSSGNKPASGGARRKRKTNARGEYTASIKMKMHQGAIGSMVERSGGKQALNNL